MNVLTKAPDSYAEASLAVLRLATFRNHEASMAGLSLWLTEGPGPAGSDPELWCEVARTLHVLGDGSHRRAARRFLQDALSHALPELRSSAALALARSGALDDPAVLATLEKLASSIGPRAALAESLIQRWEQQERFRRKLAAVDRLFAENSNRSESDEFAVLAEVLADAQLRHMEGERFSREVLLAAAADGLLRRLDPYSNFLTGKEFEEFMFDMNPEYGGIGAYVNMVDGAFTITRPIYSGPAYEAGLLSGDRILEVDGWSTADQPMDETIRRLKGKPGTEVNTLIFRRGWTEPREFSVERRKIDIASLHTEILPAGVLYLDLLSFSENSSKEIRRTLREASAAGPLTGIVLDLRGNPGGYLNEAVAICEVFLPPDSLVVTTRSRTEGEEKIHTRKSPELDASVPLAVLVDRFSASASEIVAGALTIHGRAQVFGERTHGKGSVQNILRLRAQRDEPWRDENRNGKVDPWEKFQDDNKNGKHDFGPRLKLTMAYYYLPDGSSIHTQRDLDGKILEKGGVAPDVEVVFPKLDIASLRELDRLVGEESFRTFAEGVHAQHPTLAVKLARFDGRDPSLYPGWQTYYQKLETTLDEQEVRRWVRRRLRDVVADARGKVFAGSGFFGDFQEDPVLQTAIRGFLETQGLAVRSYTEYAAIF